MSEEVRVAPTPIQRNELDVAMELTEMYYKHNAFPESIEELRETYSKFFAVAKGLNNTSFTHLTDYMPNELKQIIEKVYRR